MLKNKTVLLTGGTGSFGNAFIKRFLESDIKKIIVFSRDEKKQDDMRIKYHHPKLRFVLGDIRDFQKVDDICKGVDIVFHAAALKQVPSCEFSPTEAVKTNVFGTDNLLKSAIKNKVAQVVCLSTGKAVYPINAMGLTKALMEKTIIQNVRDMFERDEVSTKINFIRYSNIFGSRGSAVELFMKQIKQNRPITITHKNMYRSMMTTDEAVDLALFALKHGNNGDLFIYKAKRSNLLYLGQTLQKLLNAKNKNVEYIGLRHGEKLEETILSEDELLRVEDMGAYCKVVMDRRGLNYYKDITFNRRLNDLNSANQVYELKVPALQEKDVVDMLKDMGIDIKENKLETA